MRTEKRLSRRQRILILGITIISTFAATLPAREITDMAGRKVIVPATIKAVCADWSPAMYLLYALDSTLLVGISSRFTEEQKTYVNSRVLNLPIVRGFSAGNEKANVESLLVAKPDVVIAEIPENPASNAKSEEILAGLHIPVVYVRLDNSKDYPAAFLFLGGLLGRQKRSQELAAYGSAAFKEVEQLVKAVPKSRRPRVYYAEGVTGLNTECQTSFHSELIDLAGAANVHRCSGNRYKVKGRELVSLEQVILYDPDVIIAEEPLFYDAVFKDERWKNIKAVKTGKVYLVPRILFNWFDHPPSFMRLLGIKWIAWRLYSDVYKLDMLSEARRFYRLFLGIDLSDETLKRVLKL
jgi:iron complex transport system substrate-binding protein